MQNRLSGAGPGECRVSVKPVFGLLEYVAPAAALLTMAKVNYATSAPALAFLKGMVNDSPFLKGLVNDFH